jgi:hypothetical protein
MTKHFMSARKEKKQPDICIAVQTLIGPARAASY